MKKRRRTETVDTNGWLTTYSDTVTLLLCFFVLLFSYSTISQSKWEEIVKSFKQYFQNNAEEINGEEIDWGKITLPVVTTAQPETTAPSGETDKEPTPSLEDLLYEKIKQYVYHHDLTTSIETSRDEGEIRIRFTDVVLFDPDSYILREDGKAILSGLCKILYESIDLVRMIEIQGHTASNFQGQPEFTNTFEFSTYRALNVLRFMMDMEALDPYKLSAVGYGQYHPVVPNDTEENRKKNRRVEIVVISTDAARVGSIIEEGMNTGTSD